jgi:REP element-mobilizing transposase RayT
METGEIYHLYNHANGFDNLFNDDEDHELFLQKLIQHTSPIANYFSFCLMPNHFHFLAEIKSEDDILKTMIGNDTRKKISRSFASAFAGFAQKINNKYSRMGSLFMQNMSSRIIKDEIDFCSTVLYIHANPVHHGFVSSMHDWKYSSFNHILQKTAPWLDVATVLNHFGDLHEFIRYHNQPIELKIKEKTYF